MMHLLKIFFYLFIYVYLLGCCSTFRKASSITTESFANNNQESLNLLKKSLQNDIEVVIDDVVDLNGTTIIIPYGRVLYFNKKAYIKNGFLVGNNTKVIYQDTAFDGVHISGSWVVPIIKTSMFVNLDYENSLKDVIALSNPEYNNKIVIEEGNYRVEALKNEDVCIPICSNTTLIIKGSISLIPNSFRNYYIIQATGDNISINGGGSIIGDKTAHTGKDGEWGMGIELRKATNVKITNLTIKDCWGDCIYVGTQSSNVEIMKCFLDNGRRQGISITSGENILIKDCTVINVGGTNPEYAIDVEPNKGDTVKNVIIDKIKVEGCKGGFLVWGNAQGAIIDGVTIKRSTIGATPKIPMIIESAKNVTINSCFINATAERTFISYKNVSKGFISENKLSIKPTLISRFSKAIKANNDNLSRMIITSNSNDIVVKQNMLYKNK